MAIHLRQICLVAHHLHPAAEQLSDVFAIPQCFTDPAVGKFGLENTLLNMGGQFIEIVAPIADNTPAGRFLERRGGDGGYMVICQVPTLDEQAELRQRAEANNVRLAFEADRDTWNIMQLHPADMGAAFFEVDWDQETDVTGNWHPAGGTDWQTLDSTSVAEAITAVELQSDDPAALAEHWGRVVGTGVNNQKSVPTVPLANATLRFVKAEDGRGPGLGGLDIRVVDRDRLLKNAESLGITVENNQLTLCGTRFYCVD